jgi:hypothetical protein
MSISKKKVVQGVSNDSQRTYQLVNIATSLENIDKTLLSIQDLIKNDNKIFMEQGIEEEEEEETLLAGWIDDIVYLALFIVMIIVLWVKL